MAVTKTMVGDGEVIEFSGEDAKGPEARKARKEAMKLVRAKEARDRRRVLVRHLTGYEWNKLDIPQLEAIVELLPKADPKLASLCSPKIRTKEELTRYKAKVKSAVELGQITKAQAAALNEVASLMLATVAQNNSF
jgi:hypothetical protein